MAAPAVRDIAFEIKFQTQRSRGPGGQNVNKTNSSVQLRWSFMDSLVLTDEQKNIIQRKLASHINVDGVLHLRSDVHRDMESNKKEVLTKLGKILAGAFFKPKLRRATKPTRSSQRKRLESKKRHSDVKKGRQGNWD